MKPDAQKWSIIVLGQWNTRIFTPEWMGSHILTLGEGTPIPVELLYGRGVHLVRYNVQSHDLKITPHEERLKVNIDSANLDDAKEAARIVRVIAEKLPHTPIGGVGVNFGFIEDNPPQFVDELFDGKDRKRLEVKQKFKSDRLVRSIVLDECVLNLSITRSLDEDGRINIDANFHHDFQSAQGIIDKLTGSTIEGYYQLTTSLLSEIYELNVEDSAEGEDNDAS